MNCSTNKRNHSPESLEVLSNDGPPCGAQEPEPELHHSDHEDNCHSEARPKKRKTRRGNMSSPLPPISRHLPIALGGSHWCGRNSFENIVILGDSYSKSNEGKTWVDHLERRTRKDNIPTKIHNFASPGATVEDDISNQLSRFFTIFPKKDSVNGVPALDPDSTTYFVFLGINDCGKTESDELEAIVEGIEDAVHDFYVKAGARNFILVDLPPIDRSPQAVDSDSSEEIEERVKTWNELLRTQAVEFGTSSKQATVLLFSSHQMLSEVLEYPSRFDFSEDDPVTEGGGVWEDDLHLTSNVHDILAERLLASMFSQS